MNRAAAGIALALSAVTCCPGLSGCARWGDDRRLPAATAPAPGGLRSAETADPATVLETLDQTLQELESALADLEEYRVDVP